jgi:hypothetical protein
MDELMPFSLYAVLLRAAGNRRHVDKTTRLMRFVNEDVGGVEVERWLIPGSA